MNVGISLSSASKEHWLNPHEIGPGVMLDGHPLPEPASFLQGPTEFHLFQGTLHTSHEACFCSQSLTVRKLERIYVSLDPIISRALLTFSFKAQVVNNSGFVGHRMLSHPPTSTTVVGKQPAPDLSKWAWLDADKKYLQREAGSRVWPTVGNSLTPALPVWVPYSHTGSREPLWRHFPWRRLIPSEQPLPFLGSFPFHWLQGIPP